MSALHVLFCPEGSGYGELVPEPNVGESGNVKAGSFCSPPGLEQQGESHTLHTHNGVAHTAFASLVPI